MSRKEVRKDSTQKEVKAGRAKKKRRKKSVSSARASLQKFLPGHNPKSYQTSKTFNKGSRENVGGSIENLSNEFNSETGVFGVMNETSMEDHLLDINFYNVLWSKINNHVIYPKDFADHRIQGRFNVFATINQKGQVLDIREITGKDNLLKPYLLVALSKVLKSPLPSSSWLRSRAEVPVLLSFEFRPVVGPDVFKKRTQAIVKNSLSFQKTRVVESKINEAIREFYDAYVPPIILLPGGAMIDLVKVYRIYKNWNEPRKGKASDRRRRRLSYLKKELKNQIHFLE